MKWPLRGEPTWVVPAPVSWQSHTVGVVRHGCGPVGENPQDADLSGQDVERDQDVAIVVEGVQRGLVVKFRAAGPPSRQHLKKALEPAWAHLFDEIERARTELNALVPFLMVLLLRLAVPAEHVHGESGCSGKQGRDGEARAVS